MAAKKKKAKQTKKPAKKKAAPKKPAKKQAQKKVRDTGSGKPRSEKLGVKPGQLVRLIGQHEDSVRDDVNALGATLTNETQTADWIFWELSSPATLAQMNELRAQMRDDAAIWAVWPKGKPELKEDHIRNHALQIDLVDVKVMAWSDSHSGLKLVVRKSARAR